MMSGGVYLQDGLLSNYDYNKYTFRTNLQHKFNNFIKLGTHMQYTYSEGGLATTTNYDGALTELWRYGWPTLPVYREDGAMQYLMIIQPYPVILIVVLNGMQLIITMR